MWKVVTAIPPELEVVLRDGYEPFAVTLNRVNTPVVWLKKEIEIEIPKQQSRPDKGTSRRATDKTKR